MLAVSIFSFAGPVGAGFGYILGSSVTSLAKDAGASDLHAWRWSLRVTPIFGLIAVILTFLFVPEPARGSQEAANEGGDQIVVQTNLKEDLIYLIKNKTVVYCTIGFIAVTYVLGCLAFWSPKFLEDAYLAQG